MPLDTLHANHIGAKGGGFEAQRTNNAQLYILGLIGNENDVLTLSISSFPLPKESSGIIEVQHLNEKRKFAGNPIWEDLTVVFHDYVDQATAGILGGWRRLVHDPVTGKTGLKAQYAKDARIMLVAPNGEFEREYTLEGVWPSNFDPGEIDHMGEDVVRINLTLTIDKAYQSFFVDQAGG